MSIAAMIAKLACIAALLTAQPSAPDVIVRASAARPAIERILNADNLDVERLGASEVAGSMAQISRGAAPLDFWNAYQAHVRAWQDYATAKERAQRAHATDIDGAVDGAAIADSRRRINATFDVVEVVARRYGARLPAAVTRLGS